MKVHIHHMIFKPKLLPMATDIQKIPILAVDLVKKKHSHVHIHVFINSNQEISMLLPIEKNKYNTEERRKDILMTNLVQHVYVQCIHIHIQFLGKWNVQDITF